MAIELENLTQEQKNTIESVSIMMAGEANAMASEIARLALALANEIAIRAANHEKYWVCLDKGDRNRVSVVCLNENPHNAPADCGWGIVTLSGPFLSEDDARESYEYWHEQVPPKEAPAYAVPAGEDL